MNWRPHPFTLRQLQYAVAVAECLNFRAAAERCRVSQPSLSAQLAQVEAALGIRLFERDRRRVLVTSPGRIFLEHARRVLREAGALEAIARRTGEPLSGTWTLGVIPTISPYLVPRVAPALRRAYPRLRLRWLEDKTEVLMRRLQDGELEAALVALEADIGDVRRDVIARDPFVLVAPPGHPLAKGAGPVEASTLRGARVFILQDGHCFGEQAAAWCSDSDAQVDAFRATSFTTLVQMVASDAGVSLLPELAVPQELAGTRLRVRRFAEPAPARTLGLVWRKGYPFENAMRELAAEIRAAYPAAPVSARTQGSSQARRKRAGARAGRGGAPRR